MDKWRYVNEPIDYGSDVPSDDARNVRQTVYGTTVTSDPTKRERTLRTLRNP